MRSQRKRGVGAEPRGERLQKILAAAGLASRRTAEAWIRAGRVTVNGVPAQLGDRADPRRDTVAVDGRMLPRGGAGEPPAYWILHKPRGVVTTTRDPHAQETVLDLLPARLGRLFPVGRLDRETEGLLLLTNDGAVAQALLHPSLGSEREYRVSVRGPIDGEALGRLAAGVELADGRTAPARVGPSRYDARNRTSTFSLTLYEGRKRQIRRALGTLGFPVVRLVRVRMGPLRLGRLAAGSARPLEPAEVHSLVRYAAARRRGGRKGEASRGASGSERRRGKVKKRQSEGISSDRQK